MSIPPKSWGAVEMIIWNHKKYLEELGHTVDIFNSTNLTKVAESINSNNYDFVHLQYDVYTEYFTKHLKKPFCLTSHYGWLPNPNRWADEYRALFTRGLEVPGLIVLSEKIKRIYQAAGYKGFIEVLRNGVEAEEFTIAEKGNGRAVCVGNIQPRKRQALLATLLQGNIDIDFVGPNFQGGKTKLASDIDYLVDEQIDFSSADLEPDFQVNETCKYLGVWTKNKLYTSLTDYSCLALISESEADPLVVKEALAAGLSVVVSEESAANLTNEPFIYVLKDEDYTRERLPEIIKKLIEENDGYRKQIKSYTAGRFDYPVVAKEYIKIMEDFKKHADVA